MDLRKIIPPILRWGSNPEFLGNRIDNLYYYLVVDTTFLQVVQQAMARAAAYAVLVVAILFVPAIVCRDAIGLARHEVEVCPQLAE